MNFTHLKDHSAEEINGMIDTALKFKKGKISGRPLAGLKLGFCFMNPSLRTQVSMEAAAVDLGAHPVVLSLGTDTWKVEYEEGTVMDGAAAEHLKEAVPVLARYCQALALRSFPVGKSWEEDKKEPYLSGFIKYSPVPVVNLESAGGHPCQALADLMTIRERMEPRGKNFLLTWAPHVKGLPMAVPNSAAEIAALGGMNVTIARPPGFDLDPAVIARVRKSCAANGAELNVTDNVNGAFEGANVVYAKSWGSMENYGKEPPREQEFRKEWIVTPEKMRRTNSAIFMHCLPVRRNLVVQDSVLDGKSSVVIDQAENRLHTAKAVLTSLFPEKK